MGLSGLEDKDGVQLLPSGPWPFIRTDPEATHTKPLAFRIMADRWFLSGTPVQLGQCSRIHAFRGGLKTNDTVWRHLPPSADIRLSDRPTHVVNSYTCCPPTQFLTCRNGRDWVARSVLIP